MDFLKFLFIFLLIVVIAAVVFISILYVSEKIYLKFFFQRWKKKTAQKMFVKQSDVLITKQQKEDLNHLTIRHHKHRKDYTDNSMLANNVYHSDLLTDLDKRSYSSSESTNNCSYSDNSSSSSSD